MDCSRSRRRSGGFTVTELMVAIGVMATLAALAMPAFNEMTANRQLKSDAISLAGALNFARSEAIRSGNVHIVFFLKDTQDAVLKDEDDNEVPILVLDDGRPGSLNQNCLIDTGESFAAITMNSIVVPGVASGTPRAPADLGTGTISTGSSFTQPGGGGATWVMFRPEGTPVSFNTSCSVGGIGSGAGAFYLTNGARTSAVVLSPMGGARIDGWQGEWSV